MYSHRANCVFRHVASLKGERFRPSWGVDWKGRVPSPTLGTIIKKSYNDGSILSTSLGSKTLNTSLGLGEPKLKTWPGFFISPLAAFRCDAPALSRVRSPGCPRTGKMAKQNSLQGKIRVFEKIIWGKTQGIWKSVKISGKTQRISFYQE